MAESRAGNDIRPRAAPVTGGERVAVVDVLRGFAVFGILLINIYGFSGLLLSPQSSTDRLDRLVMILMILLAQAKFYSLFSFLFGWGMSIQYERAVNRGVRFARLYLRRMSVLLIFGLLHGIFLWRGDILTTYALLGSFLLLFRRSTPRRLLAWVVLFLLLAIVTVIPGQAMDAARDAYAQLTEFMRTGNMPPQAIFGYGSYWEITQRSAGEFFSSQSWVIYYLGNVFAMMMLGLYVGKRRILQDIGAHLPLIRRTFWIGLIIGLVFNAIAVWVTVDSSAVAPEHQRFARVSARTIGAPALMLCYASGLVLLSRRETWRARLVPLAPVGRMALSNYLFQSLAATMLFYGYGLGLYGEITPTVALIIVVIIYLIQIRISGWWMERFRFGPAEWLWRVLTYGRRQPLRREQPTFIAQTSSPASGLSRIAGKFNSRFLLAGIWVVLFAWAAVLYAWNSRLNMQSGSGSFTLFAQEDTFAPAEILATATPVRPVAAGPEIEIVATPVVSPVEYQPSAAAASGDVQVMTDVIDVERALDHIGTLSGSDFAGRLAGSAGGRAAGDYIAHMFDEYGLQPASLNGTFFQSFPITYTNLTGVPEIAVTLPGGSSAGAYTLYQHFSPIVIGYAGDGQGQGQVHWVNQCREHDFAGLSLSGKVVFCRPEPGNDALIASTRLALEYGAAGLLLLADEEQRPADFAGRHQEEWVPETIPVLRVYSPLVEDLLTGSSLTVEELIQADKPLALDTEATLSIQTSESTRVESRNVLGVLPGRDPDYAHEVIVVGAHYDHMGVGPEGTLWAGANDNASGVAAILEIARSWQSSGFVPRRTVLFAAWDAEEWGLIGSRHYVDHPSYPLEDTVASFQMDMVGAGPGVLAINGNQILAQQQLNVAKYMGVDAMTGDMGRSDHIPFLEAGVPATLLIWHSETEPNTEYHRPADQLAAIEPERLESALEVLNSTLLQLTESAPAIEQLVNQRAETAFSNNLSDFLGTSVSSQITADARWLADLQSLQPEEVALTVEDITFQGALATAEVTFDINYGERKGHERLAQSVHFSQGPSGWRWAGPALSWYQSSGHESLAGSSPFTITIGYPQEITLEPEPLATVIGDLYSQVAGQLAVPERRDVRLMLLPDEEAIRFSTSLSLSDEESVWVEPGLAKLVYSPEISRSQHLADTVVQQVLADNGVSEQAAPWLWQGLPIAWQAKEDPRLIHGKHLPQLTRTFAGSEAPPDETGSWAAVEYLIQELGWPGVGRFVQDFGRFCTTDGCEAAASVDRAMVAALQMSRTSFDAAWQEYWRSSLDKVQTNLNRLLQTRSQALRDEDRRLFLATVDETDPYLISSEGVWFDRQISAPLTDFPVSAEPIALLAGGDVLAAVSIGRQTDDQDGEQQDPAVVNVRFKVAGDGYKWAGHTGQMLAGDLVTIRYSKGQEELAQALMGDAEDRYAAVARILQVDQPQPIVLELYPDRESFRVAIGLAHLNSGWLPAWSEPNSGIKLQYQGEDSLDSYRAALAYQLARNLLYQKGVRDEWPLKGISAHLALFAGDREFQNVLTSSLFEAQSSGSEPTLVDFASIPADELLSRPAWLTETAFAWDSMMRLISAEGWSEVLAFLEHAAETGDMPASFNSIFGRSLADFQREWTAVVAGGYTASEWVESVDAIDGEVALDHVAFLGQGRLAGRQAGTPGAEIAAGYIARRFADYGLQPAGDLFDGSYFQSFPITFTERLVEPHLQISDDPEPYTFREQFLSVYSTLDGSAVQGELVWLDQTNDEDRDLTGKIALALPGSDHRQMLESVIKQNATGLLLLGLKKEELDLYAKQPLGPSIVAEKPVLELTLEGSLRLLEALGQSYDSIQELPAGTPLQIRAQLASAVSTEGQVRTSNVLGLLPGSDPLLGQQVIVVGAHYDHVGDDPQVACGEQQNCPPGVRYSGLNDNASGVAVMLEIARLWHEIDYRPKHSVLFAAWGAQEAGQLGSNYYLQQPVLPLTSTIAVLQLDGLGGGEGFYPGLHAQPESDGYLIHHVNMAANQLEQKIVAVSTPGESDHVPFGQQGIPSGLVSWRLASENNLPDEFANGVSPERMVASGRVVALALMMMAR